LKGIKRDLYEGGIRDPFIAYRKGFTKPGTVNTIPIALWDMYPTFLQLAGVQSHKNIDGISMLAAIKGQKQKQHDHFYWELHESGGKQAVRMGSWKGVRLNVTTVDNAPIELYDLNADPREKNNIASKHPDIVKKIEGIMQKEYVPNKDWPLMLSEMRK
jgi:arylsulfatase A